MNEQSVVNCLTAYNQARRTDAEKQASLDLVNAVFASLPSQSAVMFLRLASGRFLFSRKQQSLPRTTMAQCQETKPSLQIAHEKS